MPTQLPTTTLTEAEAGCLLKRQQSIQQFQVLIALHQEAQRDIAGLALEARGYSLDTHDIKFENGVGLITAKTQPAEPSGGET